jgi:hypothetical protein
MYIQADSFNGDRHHAQVRAAGGDPAWAFCLREVSFDSEQEGADTLIQAGNFAADSPHETMIVDLHMARLLRRLPVLRSMDVNTKGTGVGKALNLFLGYTDPVATPEIWDTEFAKAYSPFQTYKADYTAPGFEEANSARRCVRQSEGVQALKIPAAIIDGWVQRHLKGDWGTLRKRYPDDAQMYDEVFQKKNGRIHSTFKWKRHEIWVMSYLGDQCLNKEISIFLPEEY